MFKKILLPIDLSDRHERSLDVAANLAGLAGGEVELFHVVEIISGLALEEEKEFYRRLEKMARNHLAKLGEQLRQRQVPWRAEVRFGNRGPEIVRFAQEKDIDLIVLTSPRLDPATPSA